MKVIDTYQQYFEAHCIYNEVERRAVRAVLTATSDSGTIQYKVGVNFFPHREEDDFSVTFDAYAEKEIYFAKGRRSKKREAAMMEEFESFADELAKEMKAEIYWDKPLGEAVWG